MNPLPDRPHDLTEKQWNDLEEIARYRVLTLELLQARQAGESRDALRMRLERLQRQKWLAKVMLAGGEPCYALGSRAQRLLGLHHRGGFPFSTDGILEHMGIALFCFLAGFHRLFREEFHNRFSGLHRRGLPAQSYCLDREDERNLCWTVVDHASEARRFPGKILRVVSARLALDGFDALVRSGRFRVVVITATPQKRDRIQRAIDESPPASVPVSVVSLPSLLQFHLS